MNEYAWHKLREEMDSLDWSGGLTRDDLRSGIPHFPESVYLHLPSTKRFSSALRVVQYLIVATARARTDTIPLEGAENLGGPGAWGQASTGRTFQIPDLTHGVGSGADPGNTGSGSTQTGVGRSGTTYGEEYEELD